MSLSVGLTCEKQTQLSQHLKGKKPHKPLHTHIPASLKETTITLHKPHSQSNKHCNKETRNLSSFVKMWQYCAEIKAAVKEKKALQADVYWFK